MILFLVGLALGKWLSGSWIIGIAVGAACSIFLGDDDPEDPSPKGRK